MIEGLATASRCECGKGTYWMDGIDMCCIACFSQKFEDRECACPMCGRPRDEWPEMADENDSYHDGGMKQNLKTYIVCHSCVKEWRTESDNRIHNDPDSLHGRFRWPIVLGRDGYKLQIPISRKGVNAAG